MGSPSRGQAQPGPVAEGLRGAAFPALLLEQCARAARFRDPRPRRPGRGARCAHAGRRAARGSSASGLTCGLQAPPTEAAARPAARSKMEAPKAPAAVWPAPRGSFRQLTGRAPIFPDAG